ncbi:MAG: TSUP family transporter [Deltaproteobacteria bacterium]|nr:TSUP family transporter [Deltaproteobacteria bacterium]
MTPLLVPVVALAFAVEAMLGFGATVIAVALGALAVDVRVLLPAFVPVSVALSLWIVARDRAHVDVRLLARRVLPLMVLGLPVGLFAFRSLDEGVLRTVLGVVVVALALREILRIGRRAPAAVRAFALVAAGAVHGALGSGGPLVVWALGDRVADPRVLRATLSALWLALNAVLLAAWAWDGRLNAASWSGAAWCAAGLVVGALVGDALHRRVNAARFGRLAWIALAVVGVGLVVR